MLKVAETVFPHEIPDDVDGEIDEDGEVKTSIKVIHNVVSSGSINIESDKRRGS